MKKVKQANGYIIYRANVPAKDHENYGCRLDHFNIYLATDIKDYGLTYSDPEYQDIDTLAEALNICNASYYAIACALAEELSNSTCQDMDLVQEIEKRLETGEAVNAMSSVGPLPSRSLPWINVSAFTVLAYVPSKDRTVSKLSFHSHPHQLRHTYVTKLFEAGLDIKEIQRIVGHANPSITLEVYTHYRASVREESTLQRVREALA